MLHVVYARTGDVEQIPKNEHANPLPMNGELASLGSACDAVAIAPHAEFSAALHRTFPFQSPPAADIERETGRERERERGRERERERERVCV